MTFGGRPRTTKDNLHGVHVNLQDITHPQNLNVRNTAIQAYAATASLFPHKVQLGTQINTTGGNFLKTSKCQSLFLVTFHPERIVTALHCARCDYNTVTRFDTVEHQI